MATGRSTPSLIGDVIEQVTDLFRAELHLLRAEIDEKIAQATRAIVFIVAAAVLLIAALILWLSAAVDGLVAAGLQRYWAGLIVGAVVAVVGLVLLMRAVNNLKPSSLKPQRSIDQFQKAAAVVKAQVRCWQPPPPRSHARPTFRANVWPRRWTTCARTSRRSTLSTRFSRASAGLRARRSPKRRNQ